MTNLSIWPYGERALGHPLRDSLLAQIAVDGREWHAALIARSSARRLGMTPAEPMHRASHDRDPPFVPPAMGRLGKNPEGFPQLAWINQKNLS